MTSVTTAPGPGSRTGRSCVIDRLPQQLRRRTAVNARRVVTGQDGAGKSVFVRDERVEPIVVALMPGLEFVNLWGADETPALPTDGTRPAARAYFPPAPGYRFALFTLPPDGSASLPADVDLPRAMAEVNEQLPGM